MNLQTQPTMQNSCTKICKGGERRRQWGGGDVEGGNDVEGNAEGEEGKEVGMGRGRPGGDKVEGKKKGQGGKGDFTDGYDGMPGWTETII